jgi:hypothetical protein
VNTLPDVDPGGVCLQFAQLPYPISDYDVSTGFPWVTNQVTSDIEIANNTFTNCSQPLEISWNNQPSMMTTIPIRVWIHNNLVRYSVDPTTLWTGAYWTSNPSVLIGLSGVEDAIFEHNTSLGRAGTSPMLSQMLFAYATNLLWRSNLLDFTAETGTTQYADIQYNSGGASQIPILPSGGQALLTSTQGSAPTGEVWIPTWTNYNAGSPVSWTSGQTASYASLWPSVTFASGPGYTYAANIGAVGWFGVPNPATSAIGSNFRLKSASPYISGARFTNDSLDAGANIDQLEAAQGRVSNVHVSAPPTSTSFQLTFLAPDSFGCTVDWSTSNAFLTGGSPAATRVANSGGQRVQTVSITGVTANALVTYRVNCAVQQPTGSVQLP